MIEKVRGWLGRIIKRGERGGSLVDLRAYGTWMNMVIPKVDEADAKKFSTRYVSGPAYFEIVRRQSSDIIIAMNKDPLLEGEVDREAVVLVHDGSVHYVQYYSDNPKESFPTWHYKPAYDGNELLHDFYTSFKTSKIFEAMKPITNKDVLSSHLKVGTPSSAPIDRWRGKLVDSDAILACLQGRT